MHKHIKLPHQKELCKHSNHDKFFGSQYCSGQEPVQYDKPL